MKNERLIAAIIQIIMLFFVLILLCAIYNEQLDMVERMNKIEIKPETATIEIELIKPECKAEEINVQVVEQIPETEAENPKLESPFYDSPIHLSEDDRWFIECVVAGEASGESYEGKVAVAQCYFDAMLKDRLTAREVRDVYQYSGWNEHLDEQNRNAYMDVVDAVSDVFDRGHFVTDKPILYFYAPSVVYSSWHEAQEFEMEIGGHRFFYLTEDINAEWCEVLKWEN